MTPARVHRCPLCPRLTLRDLCELHAGTDRARPVQQLPRLPFIPTTPRGAGPCGEDHPTGTKG